MRSMFPWTTMRRMSCHGSSPSRTGVAQDPEDADGVSVPSACAAIPAPCRTCPGEGADVRMTCCRQRGIDPPWSHRQVSFWCAKRILLPRGAQVCIPSPQDQDVDKAWMDGRACIPLPPSLGVANPFGAWRIPLPRARTGERGEPRPGEGKGTSAGMATVALGPNRDPRPRESMAGTSGHRPCMGDWQRCDDARSGGRPGHGERLPRTPWPEPGRGLSGRHVAMGITAMVADPGMSKKIPQNVFFCCPACFEDVWVSDAARPSWSVDHAPTAGMPARVGGGEFLRPIRRTSSWRPRIVPEP